MEELENGGRATNYKLAKCIAKLKVPPRWAGIRNFDPILGPEDCWKSDIRKIWVEEWKPCIQVSLNEFAALILVLGISLDVGNKTLKGKGVFGISIFAQPISGSERWKLGITYGQRERD